MNEFQRSNYKGILRRGHGIITCGDHLGVFISKTEYILNCPPGWTFVDVDTATIETIRDAVECTKAGRKEWPEKESH